MDERYNQYEELCENIENAYRAVIAEQEANYEAMDEAEQKGLDVELEARNRRAERLTDRAEKLLHLRSDAGKVFEYIELMRVCGIKF